jgi:hypothetical protein
LDSVSEISHNKDIDITAHSDPYAKINRSDLSNSGCNSGDGQASANDGASVAAVVVTMMKMMMKTGLSGTKMIMISVRDHFMPNPVINYLKTDKCLFLQTNVLLLFLVHLYSWK